MSIQSNIESKIKQDLIETIKSLDKQIDIYTKARNNFLNDLKELNT